MLLRSANSAKMVCAYATPMGNAVLGSVTGKRLTHSIRQSSIIVVSSTEQNSHWLTLAAMLLRSANSAKMVCAYATAMGNAVLGSVTGKRLTHSIRQSSIIVVSSTEQSSHWLTLAAMLLRSAKSAKMVCACATAMGNAVLGSVTGKRLTHSIR